MDDYDELMFAFNVIIFGCAFVSRAKMLRISKMRLRRRRACWVREILRKRDAEGTHAILVPKLLSDSALYKNYFRMSKETFTELLTLLEPALTKMDTVMRKAVTAHERLGVILRFLATGHLQTILYSRQCYQNHYCF